MCSVDRQEKNVCGCHGDERVDDGDIEDARFQLHTVDELDLLVDPVVGKPRVIGGVLPEEEATPRCDIDQVEVLQIS